MCYERYEPYHEELREEPNVEESEEEICKEYDRIIFDGIYKFDIWQKEDYDESFGLGDIQYDKTHNCLIYYVLFEREYTVAKKLDDLVRWLKEKYGINAIVKENIKTYEINIVIR